MKKFWLSFSVIMLFAIYTVLDRAYNGEKVTNVVNLPQSISSSQPVASQIANAGYKDGQYTGSVADAYYGNIQVKATVSGGKITDVLFLQYPNDRETSIAINSQAMPYLKQEAISAQNAQVDIVSGATQTSQAFRESLKSALDQAVI